MRPWGSLRLAQLGLGLVSLTTAMRRAIFSESVHLALDSERPGTAVLSDVIVIFVDGSRFLDSLSCVEVKRGDR